MREIAKILAYCGAIVVLGALFAPPLYWAGRWAVETDLIPQLAKVPFSRYFNRSILLVALALLWPFLRWIGLRGWRDWHLEPNPHRWRDLRTGLVVSIVGIVAIAAATIVLGHAHLKTPFRWNAVLMALGTGVAVGLIEEVFFRGALFGVLRRSLRWPAALTFLSVFFAILHFLKPHRSARKLKDVDWLSGFDLLPLSFYQFKEPELVLVGWVTLVIFGWILGYVVVRTKSLYMSIGLHAGWVFALRAYAGTTKRKGGSVWLGKDLTTGVVPVILLLLSLVLLFFLLRHRGRQRDLTPRP